MEGLEAAVVAEEATVVAGKAEPCSVCPREKHDDTDMRYPRIEHAESPGSSGTTCRDHRCESMHAS